ncbi:MAG: hypothetical protein RBS99_17830, partial [Rhodospirillales bacterium]|nr:hypothetical protein [Rhodospirillales bacterium]
MQSFIDLLFVPAPTVEAASFAWQWLLRRLHDVIMDFFIRHHNVWPRQKSFMKLMEMGVSAS